MKTLITLLLAAISLNAFALRCGNELIRTGDPLYKIEEYCTIHNQYTVNNAIADIRKLYIKQGGMTHELIVIDGTLNTINSSKF